MPYTVENQRRVLVHRDMPGKDEGNFLLIKKENLYAAYRDLNATALCLYLYLAGNKDGFDLAFSPKAIRDEMVPKGRRSNIDAVGRQSENVLVHKVWCAIIHNSKTAGGCAGI